MFIRPSTKVYPNINTHHSTQLHTPKRQLVIPRAIASNSSSISRFKVTKASPSITPPAFLDTAMRISQSNTSLPQPVTNYNLVTPTELHENVIPHCISRILAHVKIKKPVNLSIETMDLARVMHAQAMLLSSTHDCLNVKKAEVILDTIHFLSFLARDAHCEDATRLLIKNIMIMSEAEGSYHLLKFSEFSKNLKWAFSLESKLQDRILIPPLMQVTKPSSISFFHELLEIYINNQHPNSTHLEQYKKIAASRLSQDYSHNSNRIYLSNTTQKTITRLLREQHSLDAIIDLKKQPTSFSQLLTFATDILGCNTPYPPLMSCAPNPH